LKVATTLVLWTSIRQACLLSGFLIFIAFLRQWASFTWHPLSSQCLDSLIVCALIVFFLFSFQVINCPNLKEVSLDFTRQENDSTDLVALMDCLGRACSRLRNIHVASVRLCNDAVLALAGANLRYVVLQTLSCLPVYCDNDQSIVEKSAITNQSGSYINSWIQPKSNFALCILVLYFQYLSNNFFWNLPGVCGCCHWFLVQKSLMHLSLLLFHVMQV